MVEMAKLNRKAVGWRPSDCCVDENGCGHEATDVIEQNSCMAGSAQQNIGACVHAAFPHFSRDIRVSGITHGSGIQLKYC